MSNRIIFSGMLLFTAACVTQVLNAQDTLVCSGTRVNGAPFTFPFVANTSPAPALGVACVPSGKTAPKGKAVMGTAPKAGTVFAVVLVPGSSTAASGTAAAGGKLVCIGQYTDGSTFTLAFAPGSGPAAGAACEPIGKPTLKGMALVGTALKASMYFAVPTSAPGTTLVCYGTRMDMTPFLLPFAANTSPAPTLGASCVPSGKKMPVGSTVMGPAPKASQVSAVVLAPAPAAGGTPKTSQQPNSSPPAATPAGTTPSMIATGIFNLQTAVANLQTAGNNWGPHLVNALNDINQALTACGVTPPPPSTMTSQPWANTTSMTLGIQRVTKAQTDFKNAKDPWGGRRDKALPFITQALTELQAAKKLAPGLTTVSNTTSTNPPGPPMIADGIANLQNARSNLEMAGPNWGPHLANAINYIDQALDVCGVTTPDSGMAKSVTTDLPSMMTTGTQQVTKAQTDFKNAKDPWGGRRDKTLPFITQALQELNLAATAASAPQ